MLLKCRVLKSREGSSFPLHQLCQLEWECNLGVCLCRVSEMRVLHPSLRFFFFACVVGICFFFPPSDNFAVRGNTQRRTVYHFYVEAV